PGALLARLLAPRAPGRRGLGGALGHLPHVDAAVPGAPASPPPLPRGRGRRDRTAALLPLLRPRGAPRLPPHLRPAPGRGAVERRRRLLLRGRARRPR